MPSDGKLRPFTVTGIGSLPFSTPDAALELIARCMPVVPHWPQLPRRSRQEFFTNQFLGLLVRLGLLREAPEGWHFAPDSPGWVPGLTAFYERYLASASGEEAADREFAPSPEAAGGLYAFAEAFASGRFAAAETVKGQVAGPLSVGLSLFDREGKPAYYDPQLRELVVNCLARSAAWQARMLAERCRRPVVIFVDDPAVGAWGTSQHVGLDREAIVADLAEIARAVREAGAVPGIHCCAGVDWSIPLAAGFVVLSFDAYGFFSPLLAHSRELAPFLAAGGVLAWGLVPTSPQAWEETPSSLARRWRGGVRMLEERGLDGELLRRQCILTPSCGTGLLEPDLAVHIYELTAATGELLRDSFSPGT
ncbi:MAG: hypothetical protein NUV99_07955 [Clostridia bacterium]|jgi:hypothetical protein|nr:hypothetical protein [Clostridia bacterium]